MPVNDLQEAFSLIFQSWKGEIVRDVRETIRAELQAQQAQELEKKHLSVVEVCEVYGISKVTLSAWTKAGHLKDYRIGGRKYYKAVEVMEAAKHLKKYKQSL